MKVKVKKISQSDVDNYFNLFSKLLSTQFPEYSKKKVEFFLSKGWSKKRYTKLVKSKNRLLLGAWIDKKLVGVLDAEMPFGGVSLCVWIMVDPKFQKMGIGKKLLEKWELVVKKRGAHSLYLYADKRNIAYYEKLGFKILGLWEKSWFGGDNYIFTKLIQEPKEENYLK